MVKDGCSSLWSIVITLLQVGVDAIKIFVLNYSSASHCSLRILSQINARLFFIKCIS